MKEETLLHLISHEEIRGDNKRDKNEARKIFSEKDNVYQPKKILPLNHNTAKDVSISKYTEVNKTCLEEDKLNYLREILPCNLIENET